MIEVFYAFGCNYIKFDEPLPLQTTDITTKYGLQFKVGDKITQIGTKNRTMFSMKTGHFVIYEGLLTINDTLFAIFNEPSHNNPIQLSLFQNVQYRYCFYTVFIDAVLHCFLMGSHKGMRDIVPDSIQYYA